MEVVDAQNIARNYQNINTLENSRSLVKWAFTNEPGTISEAMEYGDVIVIAALVSKFDKGPATFEEVRDQIEIEVRKQEKFKLIQAQMQGGSLDEIAGKIGTTVMAPQDISFTDFSIVGGGGSEPKVVGTIFSMQAGEMSEPIEGVTGVYVVQVNSAMPSEEATAEDIQTERDNLKRINGSRASYEPLESLKRRANISDARDNF